MGWFPWTNQSPGVGIGTGGSSNEAAFSGEGPCESPGYMPFVGDDPDDFADEWTRMKDCSTGNLTTYYLKTKDEGNPTGNDTDAVWKVGSVCYYDSGTIVSTLDGGTEINVATATVYDTCQSCEPDCFKLEDCAGSADDRYTETNLSAHVDRVVKISGSSSCWQVSEASPPCTGAANVSSVVGYGNCDSCTVTCCDCQGELGCKWNQDILQGSSVILHFKHCDCPLDYGGTLFEIIGGATWATCTSDYVTWTGSAYATVISGMDGDCADGDTGDDPIGGWTSLDVRFGCTSAKWEWKIGAIDGIGIIETGGYTDYQAQNGTGGCEGYSQSGSCSELLEEITVTNNSYCPAV